MKKKAISRRNINHLSTGGWSVLAVLPGVFLPDLINYSRTGEVCLDY